MPDRYAPAFLELFKDGSVNVMSALSQSPQSFLSSDPRASKESQLEDTSKTSG